MQVLVVSVALLDFLDEISHRTTNYDYDYNYYYYYYYYDCYVYYCSSLMKRNSK